MESNLKEHVEYAQTQTTEERAYVASACVIGLRLSIPVLIDTPDNQADIAYQGWPERLFVLSPDGKIAYQGGKGPYGFNLEELSTFLETTLSQ